MKKSKAKFANEMRYATSQIRKIQNEEIRERVENTLMWYINKAKHSRAMYYVLSLISIATSAAIPVINSFNSDAFFWKDSLISGIAALGGVAASVCALFTLKVSWNRNRCYAEQLKRECFLYLARGGENYNRAMTPEEADTVFICRMENLGQEENESWSDGNMQQE